MFRVSNCSQKYLINKAEINGVGKAVKTRACTVRIQSSYLKVPLVGTESVVSMEAQGVVYLLFFYPYIPSLLFILPPLVYSVDFLFVSPFLFHQKKTTFPL